MLTLHLIAGPPIPTGIHCFFPHIPAFPHTISSESIETDFKKRGLILEQLLVRNITLPTNVKTSIEEKIKAEQEAQKMEFVLQKEKQEAERKRVEAQGIADYQRIMSSGLTDKQLQYEQIQVLKGLVTSPNSKVIVMGKGNTPVILDTKDQKN